MFRIGERVIVPVEGYGEGVVVEIDGDDPVSPYRIRYDDGTEKWSQSNKAVGRGDVTLTKEQAAQMREALEVLGWTEDDLGPLAVPKRYGKANVEFPDDEFYYQALEALEDTARKWGGTITF